MIERPLLEELVAEARLAPSVHNIQPTRWRCIGERILVLADPSRRLPVADPSGHDVRLSHGAAVEGMALSLGRRGLRLIETELHPAVAPAVDGLAPIATLRIAAGGEPDPLAAAAPRRSSWRGRFDRATGAADAAMAEVAAAEHDLLVVAADQVGRIAQLADRANLHFLCDAAHRRELLSWMRLSPRHARHATDGLNAEALAMGRIEAFGAGLVLGPLFEPLHTLGLAGALTGESTKTRSGAIALFHRPVGEDPLLSGRAFYRAWLGLTQRGFSACPMSVLVDWPEAREALEALVPLPPSRRLVNVFRFGLAPRARAGGHSRLPVDALIA